MKPKGSRTLEAVGEGEGDVEGEGDDDVDVVTSVRHIAVMSN